MSFSTTTTVSLALLGLTLLLNIYIVESRMLNCTSDVRICRSACNEQNKLDYSATYCDVDSGNCVCDCRDKLLSKCKITPFTPCYSFCVDRNPNPDLFLYVGGVCPVLVSSPKDGRYSVTNQCACQCSLREQHLMDNEVLN